MKLERLLTVVLVVCAVATTVVVVRREFFVSHARNLSPTSEQATVALEGWQSALDKGVRMGPAGAPIQLIEFGDFECPFCASFHHTLKELRARYPMQTAVTYVHFPLPSHRFAMLAARVAECAGDQGKFEAIYDQLYDGQAEFGLKAWDDFATEAGVPDIVAFDKCVKNRDPIARIEQGMELGKKFDIRATPTVIVNGWKLGHPPTLDELNAMVQAVLAGKSPISGTS
jgi:protein-disulfide isomerase